MASLIRYVALTTAHKADRERERRLINLAIRGAPKPITYDELVLHALEGKWVDEEEGR